jgi:osmoprotectant transport system substrate-binding protein
VLIKTPRARTCLLLALGIALYGVARLALAMWPLSASLPGKASAPASGPAVSIGSKNFTESLILGELYAQAVEQAGCRVERKLNLGGTFIAHEALKRGQIDLYPEYTGTGLLNILRQSPPEHSSSHHPQKGSDAALDLLSREYQSRWGLLWLKAAEANDSQGLVVTRDTARRHGLYTLSRLARLAPALSLGSIPEFEEREDGLRGLRRHYGGFRFARTILLDNGLKYQALRRRSVDVAVAATTEGALRNPEWVLLRDDGHFWPAYQVAPVVREAALRRCPALEDALAARSGALSTVALQTLNERVDLKQEDYRAVARNFLRQLPRPKGET